MSEVSQLEALHNPVELLAMFGSPDGDL